MNYKNYNDVTLTGKLRFSLRVHVNMLFNRPFKLSGYLLLCMD